MVQRMSMAERTISHSTAATRRPQPVRPGVPHACRYEGYPLIADFNADVKGGVGVLPLNVIDQVRQNTALVYLTSEVRARPNLEIRGELLVDRGTGRIGDLHETRAGCIYIHAVTQLEISSTEVRQLIGMGRDPRFLMPDAVRKLILDTQCYSKGRTS